MNKRIIYEPKNFEHTMKKMQDILKREGKTFSGWVREQVRLYVKLHEPGNPQQRIDTMAKLGTPYKANSCQMCSRKPVMSGVKNGMWLGYCKVHWNAKGFSVFKEVRD